RHAVCIGLLATLLFGFCACGTDILGELNDAVNLPDQYHIAYEVTSEDGTVFTVAKTVDGEGNVYFKNKDEEKLFIKSGDSFLLYEKDENGVFSLSGEDVKYTQKAVDEATAAFLEYAQQSKKQFMPTAKQDGEKTILGRTCTVYKLGVGNDNTGVTYSYYVDDETGICLGMESGMSAAGTPLGQSGEVFTCTEFVTEGILSLRDKLPEA
ncbi:MAG: hypothetical protein IJZ37_02950, partial [Clostridia bacterium]|nr:hypothetical protein [Clostridia bacterium]